MFYSTKSAVDSTVFHVLMMFFAFTFLQFQGMLCARGEILLMLDSDGATQITDLEKLEDQVMHRIW